MANITYVGTHTGGIFLPGDRFVEHGATVDVDIALAADLCSRVEHDPAGEPVTQWVTADAESAAELAAHHAALAAAAEQPPADPKPSRSRSRAARTTEES